jgi:hypothetical protein
VRLLPQLRSLGGAPVTAAERLAAASLQGEGAEGLAAIRRRCFPGGELDDGGGAVPPTAAGAPAFPSLPSRQRSRHGCIAVPDLP